MFVLDITLTVALAVIYILNIATIHNYFRNYQSDVSRWFPVTGFPLAGWALGAMTWQVFGLYGTTATLLGLGCLIGFTALTETSNQ